MSELQIKDGEDLTHERTPTFRARLMIRVGLLAVVCLVVVGIGELAAQFLLGPNLSIYRLNVPKGVQVTYDVRNLYTWIRPHVTYTRDSDGLRGSFGAPSEIDILTVGGSTTDQRNIDDEYTWQSVMQNEFYKHGKYVIVANAGVDGHSTYGHIKSFDYWFSKISGLKPRFVLFYVGLNDFYKDEGYEFDDLVITRKTIRQFLRERSALYHILRTLKGIYLAEFVYEIGHRGIDFSSMSWTDKPLLQDHQNLMSDQLSAYADRLRILSNKTQEFGSTPVFITQPSRIYRVSDGKIYGFSRVRSVHGAEYNGVDYYHMISLLNQVTMETCENSGAVCIDMARDTLVTWEDDDFYDTAHMTPAGTRRVGLYLHKKLSEHF